MGRKLKYNGLKKGVCLAPLRGVDQRKNNIRKKSFLTKTLFLDQNKKKRTSYPYEGIMLMKKSSSKRNCEEGGTVQKCKRERVRKITSRGGSELPEKSFRVNG